ncbi:hypothetical protein [Arthrobacter sp. UYCu723]
MGWPALLDSVLTHVRDFGWPNGPLKSNTLGVSEIDEGQRFAVNLARSGIRLEVPAGIPLLETLEKEGKTSPASALKASAGGCSLSVLRAAPQPRDLNLTDQQKAANTIMMCCVSRGIDQELELDL